MKLFGSMGPHALKGALTLIGAGVTIISFVVAWFLPPVGLRRGSSYQSHGVPDGAEAATNPAGDDARPSLSH